MRKLDRILINNLHHVTMQEIRALERRIQKLERPDVDFDKEMCQRCNRNNATRMLPPGVGSVNSAAPFLLCEICWRTLHVDFLGTADGWYPEDTMKLENY